MFGFIVVRTKPCSCGRGFGRPGGNTSDDPAAPVNLGTNGTFEMNDWLTRRLSLM